LSSGGLAALAVSIGVKEALTLTFVDLAGAERLVRVGHASGSARLRETKAINSSLAALSNLLSAVATVEEDENALPRAVRAREC
jgi:hypothetical protein